MMHTSKTESECISTYLTSKTCQSTPGLYIQSKSWFGTSQSFYGEEQGDQRSQVSGCQCCYDGGYGNVSLPCPAKEIVRGIDVNVGTGRSTGQETHPMPTVILRIQHKVGADDSDASGDNE